MTTSTSNRLGASLVMERYTPLWSQTAYNDGANDEVADGNSGSKSHDEWIYQIVNVER